MGVAVKRRLPAVNSLSSILPRGAEGGHEFARVVDLLLFHEARKSGRKHTLFSDRSGDYKGLDSFSDTLRRDGTIGYQYKYYPSPLSDVHRREIEQALGKAISNQSATRLRKWVLVTPDDFSESSRARAGGEVSWFEGLKQLARGIELEHWGHKQLIGLFLQAPYLCLLYYPELVSDAGIRRRTIHEVRGKYDQALHTLYRRIEFVGMSVYKAEATRGVPMEDIYIPLAVSPLADVTHADRINPLHLVRPGSRSVILGDPGSGKTTLLRFLTLVGTSTALQERCGAAADARLPVFVTLRKYADALKIRPHLSLLDYVRETTVADLNVQHADSDFFEYHLDTGQAILLFDGLDELPGPQFKKTVRDRVNTLVAAYPACTTVVTSRFVGYDRPFRFHDGDFAHYTVTPLSLPDVERFVTDWYAARIENELDRQSNIDDLIRILEDPDNQPLRDLATNPLLLTIVALVHRIDAVLPDERVVLYEKCTETLLNTWHTWKHRSEEIRNRGTTERRNKRRMEAIAYWMHCRGTSTGKSERAIVSGDELMGFLRQYILANEGPSVATHEAADDAALQFLEFVRTRAGLLMEVGDGQYSFLHLTFQEYLTSAYLTTAAEVGGVRVLWESIRERCRDPHWHEVVRLLVAGLKAEATQDVLVRHLLSLRYPREDVGLPRLLGGLLTDGIVAAESHGEAILGRLLSAAAYAIDEQDCATIIGLVRTLIGRDRVKVDTVERVLGGRGAGSGADVRLRSALVGVAVGSPLAAIG